MRGLLWLAIALMVIYTGGVIFYAVRTEKKRCKESTKHIAPEVFDKRG